MKTKKLFLSFICIFAGISVNGQGSNTSLERFSKQNLATLNVESSLEDWTSYGRYYQFGRNIAIPSEGTVTTVPTLINANDAGAVTDVFILGTGGNWHTTGALATSTWKDIVNQTSSNPAYVGTNQADPCPVGYHLPTVNEMKSIIPTVGIVYASTGDAVDKPETYIDIDGSGTASNYVSDFKNANSTTTVALRFKGTDHATAFKYEWITGNGLKISAKSDKTATIDEIALTTYNWSDAVVRIFPAAGMRGQADGVASTKGGVGYYLTSNASSVSNAFVSRINSAGATTMTFPRAHAFCIRCVKDYDDTSTNIISSKTPNTNYNVYTVGRSIHVIGSVLNAKLTLFDMMGKTIYAKDIKNEHERIDMEMGGVYIVKVNDESYKIIVK